MSCSCETWESPVTVKETGYATYLSNGDVIYKTLNCGRLGGCGNDRHTHDVYCEEWGCDWKPPCRARESE